MNKTAKPLYTNPEDIKNYENRKRLRRKLVTALGGVVGGLSGAVIGGGIGMGSAGLDYRLRGRRGLLGVLLGLGVGATSGALGGRKLNDLHTGYMESAGLDPTIPHIKARLSVDGSGGAAKEAEAAYAAGFCKAAEVAGVDPAALVKRAGLPGMLMRAGWRGATRFGHLLVGGDVSKYGREAARHAQAIRSAYADMRMADMAGNGLARRRAMDIIGWGLPRQSAAMAKQTSEARKVMGARLAGTIGLGGAAYGYGRFSGDDTAPVDPDTVS